MVTNHIISLTLCLVQRKKNGREDTGRKMGEKEKIRGIENVKEKKMLFGM